MIIYQTNIEEVTIRDENDGDFFLLFLKHLKGENSKDVVNRRTKPIAKFSMTENHQICVDERKFLRFSVKLITKIIKTNIALRVLELPSRYNFWPKIYNVMCDNFTLLETSDGLVQSKYLERNRKLYKTTKILAIIFLKKHKVSNLRYVPKDLILILAKHIWEFRKDPQHLAILNVRLGFEK